MDPEKKSLNFIFPTKYVIPKSLKFSHWLSKKVSQVNSYPNLCWNAALSAKYDWMMRMEVHASGCSMLCHRSRYGCDCHEVLFVPVSMLPLLFGAVTCLALPVLVLSWSFVRAVVQGEPTCSSSQVVRSRFKHLSNNYQIYGPNSMKLHKHNWF